MFMKTCGFMFSGLATPSANKKDVTQSIGLRHSTKMFISQHGTARYVNFSGTCLSKFIQIYRPDKRLKSSTKTMLHNQLSMTFFKSSNPFLPLPTYQTQSI